MRGWALALALALSILPSSTVAAPKRPIPNYSGTDPQPATPGEIALWVPRILVSPLYFTSEFVLRRPLGALLTWAERKKLPEYFYDLFTFGPDHKAGFAPIAFIDFGFNPSFGIYLFWDDALAPGNDLRFHGSMWGVDWLAGSWTDRVRLGNGNTYAFNVTAVKRPDHAFYGVGPDSLEADKSRYDETLVDTSSTFDFRLWRSSRVTIGGGIRSAAFGHGRFGDDPSVEERFPVLPDGFTRGYVAPYEHVRLTLDPRPRDRAPGTGVRAEVDVEHGSDLRGGAGWIRWGGTLAGYLDLTGAGRVLSLALATTFADPIGEGGVPFTELVQLGGSGPMRGFLPGRLLGRSAASLTARYRWPVWTWLDGSMQFAVGNVFDDHLQGFDGKRLRIATAFGIESVGSTDGSLEILFGFGTETFGNGATIDSARIVLGTNRGF